VASSILGFCFSATNVWTLSNSGFNCDCFFDDATFHKDCAALPPAIATPEPAMPFKAASSPCSLVITSHASAPASVSDFPCPNALL